MAAKKKHKKPPRGTLRERGLEAENSRLKKLLRFQEMPDDTVYWENKELFFDHVCLGTQVTQPLGDGWRISSDGIISPSIACTRCGAHFTAKLMVAMRHSEGPALNYGKPWWDRPLFKHDKKESEKNGQDHRNAGGPDAGEDRDILVERRESGPGRRPGGVREADAVRDVPGDRDRQPGAPLPGPDVRRGRADRADQGAGRGADQPGAGWRLGDR